MSRVLAVAPHPDDETLGCGGALLRHRAEGDSIHWLIVTEMTPGPGVPAERLAARRGEIDAVASHYGFNDVHGLGFPTARLDTVPRAELVGRIGEVVRAIGADTLYLPFRGDIHSDHAVVFDACAACAKWFRQPTVRRVRVYETPSETEFQIAPGMPAFQPNLFIDITPHLDGKIAAMRFYESEMAEFPFPRSETTIRALAAFRGGTAGCAAAEAFMTVREIL
ncbi:GlcNAc-PI de-N-acetylase [Skermanella stibiiresistens SB22]|uniref:GlcNAc-PI de-N-acetylase n=1 Tax=Skermanella stibiiresistens SB22 TaxID=1385369 RepID=W9H8D2_9PROT|nr:PIG-L deacetylase family protein [Skermanella stibiiresistens]EWY42510.1 GlcNAc-PI de-N-acetylase [Skermanella stibiiresistens SB22]